MTAPSKAIEYPESLKKYAITEEEYYKQNPQYQVVCTGAVIFDAQGKMLLVQRAKDEKAFPNFWEIPGGKVDDTDESILYAVAREVKEETGLDVSRVVRKVGEFGWEDFSKKAGRKHVWRKLIFEVEVSNSDVVLDPIEHQDFLYATEDEVAKDQVGGMPLTWITPPNKAMNLEAFKLKRESATTSD